MKRRRVQLNGMSKRYRSEYSAWKNMLDRCERQGHPWFHRYGGRGITVCAEWQSFPTFLHDMGPKPHRYELFVMKGQAFTWDEIESELAAMFKAFVDGLYDGPQRLAGA